MTMSSFIDARSGDAGPPANPWWIDGSERALGLMTRRKNESRTTAAVFVAMLTIAIGAADYASGIRVSLTVFYLVPVLLATAWFGWKAGAVVSFVSVFLRILGDYVSIDEGSLPLWSLWNSFSALLMFLFIVWVSSTLLKLFRRLEQRVVERTAALAIAAERRRQLEHDLLMIASRERNAMGQELHDDICQHLVGTTLAAKVLTQRLSQRDPELVDDAEQIIAMVEDGIAKTRGLARGLLLSAIEPDELPERLADLADEITRGGVACRFTHVGPVRFGDATVAAQLYRIAQEAARNALRHAGARHIDIAFIADIDTLCLTIEDDGDGLEGGRADGLKARLDDGARTTGMGLEIMAHRAAYIGATLSLQPAARHGTRVICSMPLVAA